LLELVAEEPVTLDEIRGRAGSACLPHGRWKTLTFVAALRIINGLTATCTLPSHKVAGVREAIEAAGATLRYLPAYSPDLNPIEQAFSKLKSALRKGAARTVTRLLKLIGRLAKTLTPEECANYFQHAEYGA
jgi:transposase